MNINDIENNLGSLPVDQHKLLNELLVLAIHNNSLLKTLIAIKAVEYYNIDSSKSVDEYEKEWLDTAKDQTVENYSKILLRLSKDSTSNQ